jgi:CBS domain-containing protein
VGQPSFDEWRKEDVRIMNFDDYSNINAIRVKGLSDATFSNEQLNHFHDLIYDQIISAAVSKMLKKYGYPPSPFCFFVMGSAGRMEQSIWSDQDHGLVFKTNSNGAQEYFLKLGKEISEGLELAGYKKCSGSVMASNPLWCKSLKNWENQLGLWVGESTWESIRYLLIFADARTIYGDHSLLNILKAKAFDEVKREQLLLRMLHNTMFLKRGVGVLGQLLVETHGPFTGSINLKEAAFFPFVNAARLLSFYEGIRETPTLSRISLLSDVVMPHQDKSLYSNNFSALLDYRLKHGSHTDYDSGHYVNINKLTKDEKKTLKEIIKVGEQFYEHVRKLL